MCVFFPLAELTVSNFVEFDVNSWRRIWTSPVRLLDESRPFS